MGSDGGREIESEARCAGNEIEKGGAEKRTEYRMRRGQERRGEDRRDLYLIICRHQGIKDTLSPPAISHFKPPAPSPSVKSLPI